MLRQLNNRSANQVADQRFLLKQWFAGRFAGGAQSRGPRKPGSAMSALRALKDICGIYDKQP